MKEGVIRPIALAIIKHEDKILVMDGFDADTGKTFYRMLGGGVEFGEKAADALCREFQEELGTDLVNVKSVTIMENIFRVSGREGHEIVFIFEADLANKDLYHVNNIKIMDTKGEHYASWQEIEDINNKDIILYPSGVSEYL